VLHGLVDDQSVELLPGATEAAHELLAAHAGMRERANRVARLIHGFETPYGMELLATVHWVCRHEGAGTFEAAAAKTYAWSDRKKVFAEDQIRLARTVLGEQDWLPASAR
jgi:hypothetical protein